MFSPDQMGLLWTFRCTAGPALIRQGHHNLMKYEAFIRAEK